MPPVFLLFINKQLASRTKKYYTFIKTEVKVLQWIKQIISKKSFLQKKITKIVGVTLIYYLIFQVGASGVFLFLKHVLKWPLQRLNQSGWPYLAAILFGFIFIILISSKQDWQRYWQTGPQKMTAKTFLSLIAILLTGQIAASLFAQFLESVFQLFGLSVLAQLKDATQHSESFSMLLYAAVFGPLLEELVFRGFVLQSLNKINSVLAILGSAYLFGLYHVNFVQSPFAFLIGLVLGYTALTYGLFWSLLLHIFNNFVLGDFLNQLLRLVPTIAANEISSGLILFGGIIGVLVLAAKSQLIKAWFSKLKLSRQFIKLYFGNHLVILITVSVVIIACLSLGRV
ncbi:CPBP family intramembrane glutamic endopeptidase [Liquorilactobacillus vini]|uniref:CPBP family intramembrane glutamic endopeptidase n=1 Tax=Liquorilactobacillus vini TaxID=238015 RepID=UPI00029A2567|nr:type II CAAX endopeptidase family protein [Liquorilactobacillus vini]